MNDWGGSEFWLGIIAITYGAWLVSSWIRAKHGYAIENEWGGKSERPDVVLLREENELLKARLGAFEDRVMVLERIVTDDRQAIAVAKQIESLRDK